MIVKRQIIANVGLNKNNVLFSEDCLKKCVNNIKKEHLPITDNFDKNFILGYMTNFEYKNGKIVADIHLEKEIDIDKCVRCAYQVLKKAGENPIKVKDCNLIEGSIIENKNDAERDLL